jgi:hypothetical protein
MQLWSCNFNITSESKAANAAKPLYSCKVLAHAFKQLVSRLELAEDIELRFRKQATYTVEDWRRHTQAVRHLKRNLLRADVLLACRRNWAEQVCPPQLALDKVSEPTTMNISTNIKTNPKLTGTMKTY